MSKKKVKNNIDAAKTLCFYELVAVGLNVCIETHAERVRTHNTLETATKTM